MVRDEVDMILTILRHRLGLRIEDRDTILHLILRHIHRDDMGLETLIHILQGNL